MLAVRHAGADVGELAVEGREMRFRYHPDWLAAPTAFPLSPRLPLASEPYIGEEVLAFFANLLPEGPVLDALCRLQRLPRGNVFRLLQAFGRECAGAFELVPETGPESSIAAPGYQSYPPEAVRADLDDLRRNVPLLHRHGELRLSLAGAQNKLPVCYRDGALWLPTGGAASSHILKPAMPAWQDSVFNEALSLRLAAAVGLPVPETIVLDQPEPMLLIARYDRIAEDDGYRRLHQLDLCQLTGQLPDLKYESDGGPGLADTFASIDTHSALPAIDRVQLVDWLLYNLLIGNADAHGKNVAMLYGGDGRLRLAPTYDLLSTAYWPLLSSKMAMAIGGERRPEWVMARHWQRLCETVGLNPAQLRRRALALAESARDQLQATADSLGVDAQSPLLRHFTDLLAKRSRWIEQRLLPP